MENTSFDSFSRNVLTEASALYTHIYVGRQRTAAAQSHKYSSTGYVGEKEITSNMQI